MSYSARVFITKYDVTEGIKCILKSTTTFSQRIFFVVKIEKKLFQLWPNNGIAFRSPFASFEG